MNREIRLLFLLTAIFQALHSLEEYRFELWNHLEAARFVSELVSENVQFGFAVINLAIVILIFSSYFLVVRRPTANLLALIWLWSVLETLNGLAHMLFGLRSGGYFPGLYTAPFLFILGGILIWRLSVSRRVA